MAYLMIIFGLPAAVFGAAYWIGLRYNKLNKL